MDFSIIIVSWNVKERLKENLEALYETLNSITMEVIVIDNASNDGTVAMLKTDFPAVQLIKNQENVGFARACNQGLRLATGNYLLLLNPDMRLLPRTLSDLKAWLDANPQADVTGIKLIDHSGQVIKHIRRWPSWKNQLSIILKLPHLFPSLLHNYIRADFDYTKPAMVDSVRGAFFVIRRSALQKYGYFDERYFLWFEEVDYCRTIQQQGGQVWYTPVATAIDYVGQSFNRLPRTKKQAYFRMSMLAYFKKWAPRWQVVILTVAWWLAMIVVWLGDSIHLRSRSHT